MSTTTKYYGPETVKAQQNFTASGQLVDLRLIFATTKIKKAAALANQETGRLPANIAKAICQTCDEILNHKHNSQFVTENIQGGAGTSINMNVNEVVANRAAKILQNPGSVHPNDHVNMSQSTNDVIPTALKIVLLDEWPTIVQRLSQLENAFRQKADEFKDVIKVGRTHLQDAVPITLGQEFAAYAEFCHRNKQRLINAQPELLITNLGGTAIGSGTNASRKYINCVHKHLATISGHNLQPANNLIDATQNIDTCIYVSSLLSTFAAGFIKILNDLRLMASGPRAGLGEITLPAMQKGSSIMPGKVNPVILEFLDQICFQVLGNHQVVLAVGQQGQLELNTMLPVLIKSLLETVTILPQGLATLTEKAIDGITANRQRCQELFDNSLCLATLLTPILGYDKTTKLVKKSIAEKKSLKEIILSEGIMTTEEFERTFSNGHMTEPNED